MSKRASRIETERKLVEAVGDLLAEDGFSAVGVNAVCARAGVNKALIYRYYGGLDGLLQAYGESGDFWPSVDEVTGPIDDFVQLTGVERVRRFVPAYVAALERRPRTLAILAWETVTRNALTAHLETVRETWSMALGERLSIPGPESDPQPPVDLPAIGAIISATTHYLLLRARHIRIYGGLNLQSKADRDRWVEMLVQMVLAVVEPPR